ncbi:CheR family methyltransferase [Corallococcus exiguus]|uniref:Methyltransferase domain-containing protein n=1 Tax=Corallococcus exiguus TaxID=83462 RepID=A0A7X4YB07_9BACT|nr:CheR family methyltransferase [Corallococcus exiguus]NBC41906.1 methyltransferase domain-containing protein [Corallococcus exiguus]TNV64268.1 methyltransferase domain-containing protein [Corallococcus exiguus]
MTSSPERWTPVHAWLQAHTGMALSGAQQRRLDARLDALGHGQSATRLVAHLRTPTGAADLARLVDAVAVHTSEVFRDEVQLSAFREHVLSPRVQRSKTPLHVWSAGCAAGEEVATLLLLMAQEGADPSSRVLGTDISEQVLTRARELSFLSDALRRVPEASRSRYFEPKGRRHSLVASLRTQAEFRRHNLMEAPYPEAPGGGGFDIIFCRNVLIYFTPEAFQRTVRSLSERLAPGGVLVLSAAEPLLQVPPELRLLPSEHAFFYVREDAAPAEPVRPKRESGRFPSIATGPAAPKPEAPAVPPPVPPSVPDEAAMAQADWLFSCVLDGASTGVPDEKSERDLRRCLDLDPDHVAARYLLGLLLEQCGQPGAALEAYRRALRAVESGRARPVPFFLNLPRLRVACARAVERLEAEGAR